MLRELDSVASVDATELIATVVRAALGGDMTAAQIILKRIWPEPRGRPLTANIAMPHLNGPASIAGAIGTVIAEMFKGQLSPEEAHSIVGLFDARRRAYELTEIDARLARIEAALAERDHPSTSSKESGNA